MADVLVVLVLVLPSAAELAAAAAPLSVLGVLMVSVMEVCMCTVLWERHVLLYSIQPVPSALSHMAAAAARGLRLLARDSQRAAAAGQN